MKGQIKYFIPLAVVVVIIFLVELGTPPEIDWEPSFTKQEKAPYGAYILYHILPQLFPKQVVAVEIHPAYNTLPSYMTGDDWSYLVVNNVFDAEELDTRAILDFADDGHTVFIAAENFKGAFTDSLGIGTSADFSTSDDSLEVNFANPALKAERAYRYPPSSSGYYFNRFDTSRTVVLGTDGKGRPNFIEMRRGAGKIVLSSLPYAFTNYNLLGSNNAEYVYKSLSYLSDGGVIWDEYYKAGRIIVDSPFRYILSHASLRWAYFTTIVGVILFMIFMGRRRQRIIPVIKPLPNTTLEFVNTVAQLYYQHGDHKNLAEKKITYFLEHVRSAYGVNTKERSEELYRMIAARSGVELERVRSIFQYVERIERAERVNSDMLEALSGAIERFHTTSKR